MEVRFLAPTDQAWADAFQRLPLDRRDVFYSPAYGRLCAETIHSRHTVLCAVSESSAGPIVYPFVLRDLASVAGPAGAGLRDMIGVYGRNGIAAPDDVPAPELESFHAGIAAFAGAQGVICSFDRLHPALANERLAAADGTVRMVGDFIVADLRDGPAGTESRFRYSVQKAVRKAERSGVSTFIAGTGRDAAHLGDFLAIYDETMARNSAKQFYYFGRPFFEKAIEYLGDDVFIIYAVWEGRVVSCEMVLLHGRYGHSFLGGTLKEALPSSANQLLKRDLMRELSRRGCHSFLLGGGVTAGDGIEAYKRAFAEDGARPSYIGMRTFNPAAMTALKGRMGEAGTPINDGRFQFYDPD